MLVMESTRFTVETPENVRRALYICAARLNISVGEVIERLATGRLDSIQGDIAIADQAIEEGEPAPTAKPGRRKKTI